MNYEGHMYHMPVTVVSTVSADGLAPMVLGHLQAEYWPSLVPVKVWDQTGKVHKKQHNITIR